MKTRVTMLIAALVMGGSIFWAQTHPDTKPAPTASPVACGLDRSDLQAEAKDLGVYTSRMQSRIVMIRNAAGIVENPQLRNALQVDAEMWQDEVDHLKQRMTRIQAALDRCEARENK
jgi:hypothetical protein